VIVISSTRGTGVAVITTDTGGRGAGTGETTPRAIMPSITAMPKQLAKKIPSQVLTPG
jgi:hypothetical protein